MSSDTINAFIPGEFLLYETEDGRTRVECRFIEDSLWLTQALMADLFQVKVPTINEHLKTLYADGEIESSATIRKFLIVRQEGERTVNRNIDHYNLDAILAVGYRVRSARGTQFRRWATERLREYLVNGFLLDDERLKSLPVSDSAAPDRRCSVCGFYAEAPASLASSDNKSIKSRAKLGSSSRLRTQICIERNAHASDSGTRRMAMLRAWRRAADSGSTPTPTPASIMRQADSKLPT
jgi:hypothetical protein